MAVRRAPASQPMNREAMRPTETTGPIRGPARQPAWSGVVLPNAMPTFKSASYSRTNEGVSVPWTHRYRPAWRRPTNAPREAPNVPVTEGVTHHARPSWVGPGGHVSPLEVGTQA